MTHNPTRKISAGGRVDDRCRVCKMVRPHTVMTATEGVPQRVVCDWCSSHHNYRGGEPQPRSSERADRRSMPMREGENDELPADFESTLRRVIREEAGWTPVAPAERWRGGEMVLRPGRPGLQEKSWPIEGFFHKVVMVRNRLRALEQQVNASDLPEDAKIKLQSYVTGCYGSLTSFNVLFADEEDRFRGAGQ